MIQQIDPPETRQRIDRLTERVLKPRGLDGCVLFDDQYIFYFTDFAFIPTERPIALIVTREGERHLLVPRLELEHARHGSHAEQVSSYQEYPGPVHPMEVLSKLLQGSGLTGSLGIDYDGYPPVFGYDGPPLSERHGGKLQRISKAVDQLIAVKSPLELELIRESVRWGHLAHRLLQRYTKVGLTETEVSMRASQEATVTMMEALSPYHRANSRWQSGAHAGYRGQIGRNAAIPHALAMNATFSEGDVLVTGAAAPVLGYLSELERTMVIGKPTHEQVRYFDLMLGAQDTALSAMRPGATCAEVDQKVRAYMERHHLEQLWRHHSGHSISFRYHESPFLDVGDPTPLEAGMVFTVEPGIYVPELGGFRHSDTVLVTEGGVEMLTYYPRDLGNLTIWP
jgi:Xaa-Pro aminopeptidase